MSHRRIWASALRGDEVYGSASDSLERGHVTGEPLEAEFGET
ncbi:hypothetical protein [Amycolatopsis azurea]|uniref:Uncharacterized protein n=1 Tax=Amycolatopsis azurea DSM 43854 TaxID=1238180 RepID=M2Q8L4_9PSEU|nr:hypothetical protein [Amycolatopsis azurea]EMD22996.1 hypothetical protein C791_7813 [Amycolatopsis azurea DSM 43854]